MVNDNLSTAFVLLEKHKDLIVCSSGEKKEDLIEEAQNYLGIYFPTSYKIFLRKFGLNHLTVNKDFNTNFFSLSLICS